MSIKYLKIQMLGKKKRKPEFPYPSITLPGNYQITSMVSSEKLISFSIMSLYQNQPYNLNRFILHLSTKYGFTGNFVHVSFKYEITCARYQNLVSRHIIGCNNSCQDSMISNHDLWKRDEKTNGSTNVESLYNCE